ncbi:hypothetical protein OG21DRAFT_1512882 [Imleria badia]|nr:hypothetical protein OG21DRAFT_1512882 [Imleria badia]
MLIDRAHQNPSGDTAPVGPASNDSPSRIHNSCVSPHSPSKLPLPDTLIPYLRCGSDLSSRHVDYVGCVPGSCTVYTTPESPYTIALD